MMKRTKIIYLALPLLLSSCIKSGYDWDNCPGEYEIIPMTPAEIGNPKDELKNTTITVVIDKNGNETKVNSGSGNAIDLDDGQYTFVTLKNTEGVSLSGTTIKVETNTDGTAKDAGSDVIGGSIQTTIGDVSQGSETNTHTEIPTHTQTRPLVINITFEGENAALVSSLNGAVEGIALERDINNGFVPVDGTKRPAALKSGAVTYDFTKQADKDNAYTQSHVLIGIDGKGNQTLTFMVTYTDGTTKTYVYDITTSMDGFHTEDVTKPWVIDITLRLGADFTATIEDWIVGPDSYMDAH